MYIRNVQMARIGAQVVSGSNMVGLMTEVAARYNAVRHPRVDPGSCTCHGGSGNCTGCESSPVIRTFKRVPGTDGHDGQPGTPVNTLLFDGTDGTAAQVIIVVEKADGSTAEYDTVYNLELVDFDVEDENGDGIFEPSEHLYIKRIRVRNSGS